MNANQFELVTLGQVNRTVQNEREVAKNHGQQSLALYRSLREDGDNHTAAMETLLGEKLMAQMCRH